MHCSPGCHKREARPQPEGDGDPRRVGEAPLNLPAREPAATRRAGSSLSLSRKRSSAERADPPGPGECQDHVLLDRVQGLLDSRGVVRASERSVEADERSVEWMRGDLYVVCVDDLPVFPKHGLHEASQPVVIPPVSVVESTS